MEVLKLNLHSIHLFQISVRNISVILSQRSILRIFIYVDIYMPTYTHVQIYINFYELV